MKKVIGVVTLATIAVLPRVTTTAASGSPTIDAFLSPPYPQELVAAKKADRIAWWSYERGLRNVFTAAGPEFRPLRVTNFLADHGVEISDLQISDDGSIITLVRGRQPNREGWVGYPTSAAKGADRTGWAATTSPAGGVWKIGEGTTPALSPSGHTVVFAKDGQIYQYAVARPSLSAEAPPVQNVPKPRATPIGLIRAWGTNGNPVWSPDGTKVA